MCDSCCSKSISPLFYLPLQMDWCPQTLVMSSSDPPSLVSEHFSSTSHWGLITMRFGDLEVKPTPQTHFYALPIYPEPFCLLFGSKWGWLKKSVIIKRCFCPATCTCTCQNHITTNDWPQGFFLTENWTKLSQFSLAFFPLCILGWCVSAVHTPDVCKPVCVD